ncbi:hypothetical protein [Clostridium sp. Marseille-QA1073]
MRNNSTIKRFMTFFIILTISMIISSKFAWLLLTIVPLAYLIFLFKKSSKFKSRNIIIKEIISAFLLCTVLTGIGGIATEFEASNETTKKIQQIISNKNSISSNESLLEENSKNEREEQAKRIAEEKAKREVEEKKEVELKEKQVREELAKKEQVKKEAEEKARRDAEEKKQLEKSIANNSINKNNNIECEVELDSQIVNDDISVVVYITKTGKKYHSDWCGYLSKSKIETTLENAMNRGYTPCSKCGPPQ